jgi:hypothetical protein
MLPRRRKRILIFTIPNDGHLNILRRVIRDARDTHDFGLVLVVQKNGPADLRDVAGAGVHPAAGDRVREHTGLTGLRPGRRRARRPRRSARARSFTAARTMRSRTEGIDSGLCSVGPGFGMSTRRVGNGRWRRSFDSVANSSSSRATPYSSTSANVVLSMPGAPLLRRTATHARHKTSLRKTLSRNAWNDARDRPWPPGTAHAARHEPGPEWTPTRWD